MSALKDIYSPSFYSGLSKILEKSISGFHGDEFERLIFTEEFKVMELKQRMRHTACALHNFMPVYFPDAVPILRRIVENILDSDLRRDGLACMFLPDYVEVYGLEHYHAAVEAMEFITQFTSCEFAVRLYLLKYPQMLPQMIQWSTHENFKVRRFASEGTRPRLPWAMAIPYLKKDPSAIVPLLENLMNDPAEWVRRSVANNLNDIAKDNPEVVLALAKKWIGRNKETDAIIKHGCRTLLKQGHPKILKLYGLDATAVADSDFKVLTPIVRVGECVAFTVKLTNTAQSARTVRLEYGLYYLKANGALSRKVFKVSEKNYYPGETVVIERKQSFKLITTRKFYKGEHKLSVIINGEERQPTLSFMLI